MSMPAAAYRRRLGRAPSPPTWLWYEQIPYDDDSSCSDDDESISGGEYDENSCSEDDEDYVRTAGARQERGAPAAPASESGSSNTGSVCGSDESGDGHRAQQQHVRASDVGAPNGTMDIDDHVAGDHGVGVSGDGVKKDVKGKQRAVEPEVVESPKHRERRKKRDPLITLRPILTIQKSQGFVWNQDLFVPPYIKDRYIASTSAPNANGCVSTTCTSSYNGMPDYEVDVVEIRVKEGEFAHLMA